MIIRHLHRILNYEKIKTTIMQFNLIEITISTL